LKKSGTLHTLAGNWIVLVCAVILLVGIGLRIFARLNQKNANGRPHREDNKTQTGGRTAKAIKLKPTAAPRRQ